MAINGAFILILSDGSDACGIAGFEKPLRKLPELAAPKALLEKVLFASA